MIFCLKLEFLFLQSLFPLNNSTMLNILHFIAISLKRDWNLEKDPLKDEVRLLLEKAAREKEEGELLLHEKYPEGAINRFFYSAFHLAVAILRLFGETPRTPSGVIQRFSLLAVDRKEFAKQHAKTWADLFRARQTSDYITPSLIDVSDVVHIRTQFVDYETAVRARIQEILNTLWTKLHTSNRHLARLKRKYSFSPH